MKKHLSANIFLVLNIGISAIFLLSTMIAYMYSDNISLLLKKTETTLLETKLLLINSHLLTEEIIKQNKNSNFSQVKNNLKDVELKVNSIYNIICIYKEELPKKIADKTKKSIKLINLFSIIQEERIKLFRKNKLHTSLETIHNEIFQIIDKNLQEIEQNLVQFFEQKKSNNQNYKIILLIGMFFTAIFLFYKLQKADKSRKKAEIKLKNNEEKFRLLFENSPVAYFTINQYREIINTNAAWTEITGYSPNESLGKTFETFLIQNSAQRFYQDFVSFTENEEIKSKEYEFKTKNGSTLVILLDAKLEKNLNINSELSIYCGLYDISERKRNEKEMERKLLFFTTENKSNNQLQIQDLFDLNELNKIQEAFAQATHVTVTITDINGNYLLEPSNNNPICKLINENSPSHTCAAGNLHIKNENTFTQEACSTCSFRIANLPIVVGDKKIAYWKFGQIIDEYTDIRQLHETGKKLQIDNDNLHEALSNVHRMSNKQFRKVGTALQLITNNLAKSAYLNLMQAQNILALEKSRKILKESELRFKQLANSTSEAIIIHKNRLLLISNDEFYNMFGYEKNTTIFNQNNLFSIITPEQSLENLEKLLNSNILSPVELSLQRSDKHIFPAEMRIKTMEYYGDEVSVCIIRDLTRQKESERRIKHYVRELERNNRELIELTTIATHDLREPLRAITSYCQLLKDDLEKTLSTQVQEDINYITNATNKMGLLFADLLQLLNINNDRFVFQKVNLNFCIEQAINTLQNLIETKKVEIILNNLPNVKADLSQLSRVFYHLIKNAIQFNKKESPKIIISVEEHSDKYIISVSDNGIGIETRYIEQIFAPFKRLANNNDPKSTGIGLTICKRIIERHGQKLWVESIYEIGSSFKFTLETTDSLLNYEQTT